MKKHLKIDFADYGESNDKKDSYFIRLLEPYYNIEISDEPDFVIYSCYDNQGRLPWSRDSRKSQAQEYKKYKCIRIFYTSENVRPNFNECDYAFTFDYINNPHHYRLPYYGIVPDEVYELHPLIKPDNIDYEQILQEKTKFCNFIYSNGYAKQRVNFFEKLSKYKKVDSGGRVLNNIGYPVNDKLEFIKPYKFTIAFENASYPGYTTEKIYEPMLVNSLPIYWGNKLVHQDFNPQSFLNYHDFENEDELIERIIEIDKNDELYITYLKQPWFHENQINQFIDPQNVLKQFDYIINSDKLPIAQKKKKRFFFF
ncbi:MAG: glycosyltransferase family 10 [Potamolinea sp.]